MENPYFAIILLTLVSAGFLITMLVLSSVLGPRYRTATKQLPFECGSVSIGDTRSHRFNVRFYVIAMLFILFDVEVIFMYPWAIVYRDLLGSMGVLILIEMLVFVAILAVGLIYVWRKGVLDWSHN